jgi:hypothetical protein
VIESVERTVIVTNAAMSDDKWLTADNYTKYTTGIDELSAAI